jgi:transcriptional regulator with XRE-family HTH domain
MSRFKRKRLAAGLTQCELAKRVESDPSTVSKWESGTLIPAPHFYPKLAALFQCSADEVVDMFVPATQAATA